MPDRLSLIIHIDGGARGNPGPAAAGVVIQNAQNSQYLHEAGYFLGRTTNNVAEYQGLLHGLKNAADLGAESVQIHSDSELMVRQINGEYRVKSAHLRPLHDEAQSLLNHFAHWTIQHVCREQNKLADDLANRAIDAQNDVHFES